MSKLGFYAANELRAYPLLAGHGGIDLLSETLVDFGCVMLPGAEFDHRLHKVWLYQIEREDDQIRFDFRSDAPGLEDRSLVFKFDAGDKEFSTRFATDSPAINSSTIINSSSSEAPDADVLWEGYLTVGRVFYAIYSLTEYSVIPDGALLWRGRFDTLVWSDVAALLWTDPGNDGTNYSKSVIDQNGETMVEPALIQNLSRNLVKSVRLMNKSRTVAGVPLGCPGYSVGAPDPEYFDNGLISGNMIIKPGYNSSIDVSPAENSVTIGGAVGYGAGEPCVEVPLHPAETSPDADGLLTGGPRCGDVIKTINGLGGRVVNIKGGLGVTVKADPNNTNGILVTPDHHGMAICSGIQTSSVGGG